MDIIYIDESIIVCIKPAGVLSTDEEGGLPQLLREYLGDGQATIKTVHRLDRVVSGLMVLARNSPAAAELSKQIRDDEFGKEYLAVVHGITKQEECLRDLMYRDKARKMSFVTDKPDKGVQEAILEYSTIGQSLGMSMVRIKLITGRTHQIRCQFAARSMPLVGEKKYNPQGDDCDIALWSAKLSFRHPKDGRPMVFERHPPETWPWTLFQD